MTHDMLLHPLLHTLLRRKFISHSFAHREQNTAHMASSSTIPYFSNQWLTLWLLVRTVIFCPTESAATIQLKGEVGGNVTFKCPVDNKRIVKWLYFQRDVMFLNGYHTSKKIPIPKFENTRMEPNSTHVHMFRLNISHNGMYQCIIQYNDGINTDHIQLTVTAPYSKPTVTQSCDDDRCLVTCASYGGYPGTKVAWIPGSRNTNSQPWKVENNTQVSSPSTMLVNSSSTVNFNCSHGELKNLSCSVGNVTSDLFSVCTPPKVKPNSYSPIMIAVACVVLLVILIVIVVALSRLCCWYKKVHTGKDCRENGNKEELEDLKEKHFVGVNQLCEKEGEKEDPVDDFNAP